MEITTLNTNILDTYTLTNNTYSTIFRDSLEDKIEIEIGDITSPVFRPLFKFKRWDGEVEFSILGKESEPFTLLTESNVIKYITDGYNLHMCELPYLGDIGGFKLTVVADEGFNSKELNFTMSNTGMTLMESEEGYKMLHKTKMGIVDGKNYGNGEILKILQPNINGDTERALEFHIDGGNLIIKVPNDIQKGDKINLIFQYCVDNLPKTN